MTIAERKAKEAHERENPWRNMNEPRRPGLICNLLFNDIVGHYDTDKHYVEYDGKWWGIDPPERIFENPMNWRAAYVSMSLEKRALIKKRYDEKWG